MFPGTFLYIHAHERAALEKGFIRHTLSRHALLLPSNDLPIARGRVPNDEYKHNRYLNENFHSRPFIDTGTTFSCSICDIWCGINSFPLLRERASGLSTLIMGVGQPAKQTTGESPRRCYNVLITWHGHLAHGSRAGRPCHSSKPSPLLPTAFHKLRLDGVLG